MKNQVVLFLVLAILLFDTVPLAKSQEGGMSYISYTDHKFNAPVDLQYTDYLNGLVVVEQGGTIQLVSDGNVKELMDISDRVAASSSEMGLLGLAFHPNFADNGRFYVDYTANNPRRTVIAEYTLRADQTGDTNSERVLLEVEQPYTNHNAGSILFADGYLYITLGDGGSGGDPQNHGQNPQTLLGSILRIDVDNKDEGLEYAIPADNPFVDQDGFLPEIYAYGLRNPWKISFDQDTGYLFAADVGQSSIEEVNIIEPGKNYGWNLMEGSQCYISNCDPSGLNLPFTEYDHSIGNSITGGYVNRDVDSSYHGIYIYADFPTGKLFSYDITNFDTEYIMLDDSDFLISTFGQLPTGQLVLADYTGKIYQLIFPGDVTPVPNTQGSSETISGRETTETLDETTLDRLLTGPSAHFLGMSMIFMVMMVRKMGRN